MLSISPVTIDLYREEGTDYHRKMVDEGLTFEEINEAKEKFDDIVNSFLVSMEEAGFTPSHSCGQIYFENNNFSFMLSDYI